MTMKTVQVAAVVLGVIVSMPIANAQSNIRIPPGLKFYNLKCSVAANTDFSNSITLSNIGSGDVPKNTKVHWNITAPQFPNDGDYTFVAGLAGKSSVSIDTKLATPTGTPCEVKVVK